MVLGLIGSIGSGKSRLAELLRRHGGRVVSGDEAGHEALCQPDIRASIRNRWGSGVVAADGSIDRRKLGAIVFADPAELKALEELVFPYIRHRLQEAIEEAKRDGDARFIVLDAAVLLEAGWHDKCDRIVFVDAPRPIRLERVARQRRWTDAELSAREKAQLPLSEKAARADFVIDNAGPEELLAGQLEQLVDYLEKQSS